MGLAWLNKSLAWSCNRLRQGGKALRAAPGRFQAWWRQRGAFARHLLISLLIGLVIESVLHVLHHRLTVLQELEDMAVDGIMKLSWGTALNRPATPFVLLDIDERTYRTWDEPFYIPRNHLLELIDFSVQGHAALVIVDVDLSQRGHDAEADQRLQDYLAHYGTLDRPPLLLARAFRPPLPGQNGLYPMERRSFLEADSRIAQTPLIQWGSTWFELDQDRLLRRWRLWQIACNDQSRPVVAPSLQLLALAFLSQPDANPQQVVSDLRKQLQPLTPASCDQSITKTKPGTKVAIAEFGLNVQTDNLAQRIFYELPWRLQAGQAYPLIEMTGNRVPLLSILSALPITDGNHKPLFRDAVAGRVVIIGGSFWESRDLHLTPVGQMPGSLVLINAIHSLQQHGEVAPPPLYYKLPIVAALIMLISLVFVRLNSFRAMLAAILLIMFALLPLSYYWFKTGVWLDFSIPLCAVALHWMAARFEEHHRILDGVGDHRA